MPLTSSPLSRFLIVSILIATTASGLPAAGFQIFDVGVRSQGAAHAGMATRAEGPETVYFNPAAMVYLPGDQISFGFAQHFVKAEYAGRAVYSAAAGPLAGLGFENAMRGADGGDLSLPATGFYAARSLSDKLKFGLSVNSPVGLSTDYGREWAGRYLATRSSLIAVNLNPSLAYRVNDSFSVAAGFDLVYAKANLRQALDLGLFLAPLGEAPGMLANDGLATIEGEDWAPGFNLGAIFEPVKGTRFGISYRSEQKLEIEGTARFDTGRFPPEPFGPALAPGAAASSLKLPQWATFGLHHSFAKNWAAMVDATWTDWSVIEELRLRFPDSSARPDTVLPVNWKNSWRFSGGITYEPAAAWTLRGGLAHESTPVPDPQNYTPRVPAGDGLTLAVGISRELTRQWTLDAAYTRILIDELDIDRTEGFHKLSGGYDGAVNIVGLQLRYTFK